MKPSVASVICDVHACASVHLKESVRKRAQGTGKKEASVNEVHQSWRGVSQM